MWDLALDLKNFHEASHAVPILPILVATEAPTGDLRLPTPHEDQVYPPVQSNSQGLRGVIDLGLSENPGALLDGVQWGTASYHPTPTIIEAAQSLYAQHSVDAIARHPVLDKAQPGTRVALYGLLCNHRSRDFMETVSTALFVEV